MAFVDNVSKPFGFAVASDVDLLIWTTTPWTLPANLAIAVHPDFDYVLIEAADRRGDRRRLILAEALVDQVSQAAGLLIL